MLNNKKQLRKNIPNVIMAMALLIIITGFGNQAFAQFTFVGDYDRTFAAPLGYYIDPQNPVPPANDTNDTHFYTGEFLPDGSIIVGGRHVDQAPRGDFYLRKFTPSGAVDTSFGTNGFVRTTFNTRFDGVRADDSPYVLKVQPDGKILFAGHCDMLEPNSQTPGFQRDACVIRYNANGTLDQSFGGGTLTYTNAGPATYTMQLEPGKVIFQTGIIANGLSFGTGGTYYDMAIQPDGKIVLVGDTRNYASFFGAQGFSAIIVRLNPNGSLDTTFGSNGIARWTAPEGPANCFPPRRFNAVRLQPDGRIIAVGFNSTSTCSGSSATGNRFVVTRWTAAGQLETVRHFDNRTAFEFQDESATSVHLTRDASKILVSGSYLNQSGVPVGRQKPTMIRLNIGDLSLDTSFGNGGIAQYNIASNGSGNAILYVKAIQPDGRMIGIDNDSNGRIVRFNPDGSSDQSFGNRSIDNSTTLPRGRLRVIIPHSGFNIPIDAGHILVRPNGRINLVGRVGDFTFGIGRAVVSQQNTVFKNGNYSDFTNDGKADISVFRPSDGIWHQLNSQNNNYSAVRWGISSDKLAPADFDGDGKADISVFRDGFWYWINSSNGAFSGVQFGQAGDLPVPADYSGDGRAELAIFRSGFWYTLDLANNQFQGAQFGVSTDKPVAADYDGDGKADIAVVRQTGGVSTWYILGTSQGFYGFQFGTDTDKLVPADYDGDGKVDAAVYRSGFWYILGSAQGFYGLQFGIASDIPVAADYDGDGKADTAVYRDGVWYLNRSAQGFTGVAFGAAGDRPIPAAYVP